MEAVVSVAGWDEIQADFAANVLIYVSMPFVAAFVGWSTKIVAMEMLYRPLEFRGVGPIGWQGIVPRRAGRVGAKTIQLLTERLLKPEELLDNFDAREAIEALRGPLAQAIDEMSRELADELQPGLWDAIPSPVRRAVLARVETQLPQSVENLMREIRADLPRYVDVQFLAVKTLVRHKQKLNQLMRSISGNAMAFMRRSGIYFGLGIGVLQVAAWALFHNPWIMPAFGFGVGFLSDYIALTMLFRPIQPRKYFGLVTYQGQLHAERERVTRDYARIVADDLLAPEIMLDSILHGPGADSVMALIAAEVGSAFEAQTGRATPLVRLAVGTARYNALKAALAEKAIARIPTTFTEARDFAHRTLNLENTIVEKMELLTSEEYESILRPVFKDDEPTIIAAGAILGGLVGELQILMIERFGHQISR